VKRNPLIAFLAVTAVLSAGFILAMKLLGQRGFYLGQVYMLVPAISAFITRLVFYEPGFSDAHLRLGRLNYYLKFYVATLGIVAASYVLYTAFSSVTWDFTGDTFLSQFGDQLKATGQDINDLPQGLTPKMMLLIFFIGGLTVFNIPFTLIAFGEEFGWRGFMLPRLYVKGQAAAFVGGGLIWFAWHTLLVLVYPETAHLAPWEHVLNAVILAGGTICTFVFLAYVFVKTESIWAASFAHAVFNNASRSLSYFATVKNQLMANLALTITMALVVAVLYFRGELKIFANSFLSGHKAD
jgi:membrane protease YdiL (CAAX protease family)